MKWMHLVLGLLATIVASNAGAVRPFITDDARVVGLRLAQLEGWTRFDRHSGQGWYMFAYGPTQRLELSLGGVFGYDKPRPEHTEFSYALPLIQGKMLLREYSPGDWPGIGFVAGTFLPAGLAAFVPPGYGAFGFLTVSQCLGEGEKFLFHLNTGLNYLYNNTATYQQTWGLGTQIKTYKGFHLVGEIFSGDPYIAGTGTAYQVGFRHFFSDLLQIDATVGESFAGTVPMPLWASVGVRIVTTRFEKK
jgi:hypothetical protein